MCKYNRWVNAQILPMCTIVSMNGFMCKWNQWIECVNVINNE